jgi:hypothetical protein
VSGCEQELCPNWDGWGCPCDLFDIEKPRDPYSRPVFIQGHNHSEPVCAWPDCETYLTREEMRQVQADAE